MARLDVAEDRVSWAARAANAKDCVASWLWFKLGAVLLRLFKLPFRLGLRLRPIRMLVLQEWIHGAWPRCDGRGRVLLVRIFNRK